MAKKEVIEKLKQYADLVRNVLPVETVILQNLYPGETERTDGQLDVVIVVHHLPEDEDYIAVKEKLCQLAQQIDGRIDPELIESEKEDYVGFYKEIQKNGEIIYMRP